MKTDPTPDLDAFQQSCVDLFVNAASTLALPRSIGEIYGLLFSTEEPLSLDDVTARLKMSRGSAHEGLRWLRNLGAVRPVYLPGVRKEHFTAETSLRRLATGYLRDQIEPHIENGQSRLAGLRASVNGSATSFQSNRLTKVTNWYKFLKRALPVIKALSAKF